MKPTLKTLSWLVLPGMLLALAPACGTGNAGEGGADAGKPDAMPKPDASPNPCDDIPQPPECNPDLPPAPYVRGSLAPAYELMGNDDLDKFEHKIDGESTGAEFADYQTGNVEESETTQLQQLQGQLIDERNDANAALAEAGNTDFGPLPTNVSLLPSQFQGTADGIPFRGKPSDVAFLNDVGGKNKAYIPLAGRWSVPGNEVQVVDFTDPNNPVVEDTIEVGLMPIAVAADPETDTIFVCNKSSNYISVIDANTDDVVAEVRTKYYCSDILAIDPRNANGNDDFTTLYVANEWLGQILIYDIKFEENTAGGGNDIIGVTAKDQNLDDGDLSNDNAPSRVIAGVGSNPQRLTLSQSQRDLYVANVRGGEMAVIRDIENYDEVDTDSDGTVDSWTFDLRTNVIDAPTAKIIDLNNNAYILTMMRDRGYPAFEEEGQLPREILGEPKMGMGVDGQMHVVHLGAQFDDTRAYNFEDIRSGILQLDANLSEQNGQFYYVDDNDPNPDDFFAGALVLAGAQPRDAVANAAQDKLWVAYDGSELIQVFDVNGGNPNTATLSPAATIDTHDRGVREGIQPFALAIDEDAGVLLSVNRGSGTLQIISLDNNQVLATTDPFINSGIPYPATNIERGEYLYANANWSNDGRKSCVSCHFDDQMDDGVPYANGATAPTSPHRVKPTWNLMDTENYFWNGSFRNNSYKSVAFAAQTKTNCEQILFGFSEGITSDPQQRVGDPADVIRDDDQDQNCRPSFANGGELGQKLPDNFTDVIAAIILNEKVGVIANGDSADEHIKQVTGQEIGVTLSRDEASAFSDWYGAGYRRLPPNPRAQLFLNGTIDPQVEEWINEGKELFLNTADCDRCHIPTDEYQDNKNHGPGAGWMLDFKNDYEDQIVAEFFTDAQGNSEGLPQTFLDSVNETSDAVVEEHVINFHYPTLDFFDPFCFDVNVCLNFKDPYEASGQEEDDRVSLWAQFNIVDPDRQWFPGQPSNLSTADGASVNTPSLRGVWWGTDYLRTGFADDIREAILPPGHKALDLNGDGQLDEDGFAWASEAFPKDVHGFTSGLNPDQVRSLVLYVRSIPAEGTLDNPFYIQ